MQLSVSPTQKISSKFLSLVAVIGVVAGEGKRPALPERFSDVPLGEPVQYFEKIVFTSHFYDWLISGWYG